MAANNRVLTAEHRTLARPRTYTDPNFPYMPDPEPAPPRIETEVLSGAEMHALIAAGRVILREAPAGDPLGPVLASAIRKLMDAVGISDD